jgi:short-subunit dehydrogenase
MKSITVITGASRGLGAAIATSLAAPGSALLLTARNAETLEQTAEAVRSGGATAITLPLDMSLAADRERLVAAAEALGEIDIFINNAGVECPLPVTEQPATAIEDQLQVNLHAPIYLSRRVLPGMIARRRGTIVMISSISGKTATPYNAIYAATKYGLNGFACSLEFELAGTGVHVGVVCPGFVSESGMWRNGGVKAPAMMREVSPGKVVKGVRKILAGKREALVTPMPMRPLLALAQLAPRVVAPLTRLFGIVDVLEQRMRAEREKRRIPKL